MIDRRTFAASLVLAGLWLATPAQTQASTNENFVFSNAYARSTAPMAMAGVAYITIESRGEADRLLGFATPACNRPELHTHIDDNGVMRMRQVDAIDVPAGGVVELKPGGLHLMMIDLNQQLVEGESVEVTLQFEKAGEITLTLPIQALSGTM